jgi:hypothetical protein
MDLFDRWEAVPTLPDATLSATLSFGGLEAATPPRTRWQMDLPANPAAASQQLAADEAQALTRSAGLDQVPGRLERLLLARQSAQSGAADFAALGSPALSEAELGLWRWMDEAEGREGAAASYGLAAGETHAEAAPAFTVSLERLQRLLAYAAWVETRVEGQWLGQTVVTWMGDLRTVWGADVAPAQCQWHSRSLRLALASRGIALRAFFITAQSAVKLAALLALPGGAVLALPAAWEYVHQMLAEIGEYRKLENS